MVPVLTLSVHTHRPSDRPGGTKADLVERSMGLLLDAQAAVGGEVVSGGGTGTWEENRWVTELQAGSYCLMDTEYTPHAAGFENALTVLTTVVSKSAKGWGVLDAGLTASGRDHGDPQVLEGGWCWVCRKRAVRGNGGAGRLEIG